MEKKITSGAAACRLLVDTVFELLEELDDLRTANEFPPMWKLRFKELVAAFTDGLGNDPEIFTDFASAQSGEVMAPDVARAYASKGFLDDNDDRLITAPREIHTSCWYSHLMGAVFAIKDGLKEISEAVYKRDQWRGNAPYGPVCTRNTGWKKKAIGRPRKAKNANKGGRPPGRPIDPNSNRQKALNWGEWEKRRQWREAKRKQRRKAKRNLNPAFVPKPAGA